MKKTILLLTAVLCSLFSFSQDLIIKKNGEEIKAKVEELSGETVKYRKFENITGPLYNIDRKEVFQIRYENGTVENIATAKQAIPVETRPVTSAYDSLMKMSKREKGWGAFGIVTGAIFTTGGAVLLAVTPQSEPGATKTLNYIFGGVVVAAGLTELVLGPLLLSQSAKHKKQAQQFKGTSYFPIKLQFYPTAIGTAPGAGLLVTF